MILQKKLQILLGLASALLLCVPLVSWLSQSNHPSDSTLKSLSNNRYPAPRQAIRGLSFTSVQDGKSVLSIEADSFRIEKKKVGILRIGLAEEAILENARIRIYTKEPADAVPDKHPSGNKEFESAENSRDIQSLKHVTPVKPQKNNKHVSLGDIFSKQAMPAALTSKKLAFISAVPISIEVCNREDVVTRFTADHGSFSFRKRTILLAGNVTVKSDGKLLRTTSLEISPKHALMKANGAFTLTTPNAHFAGERLMADILLNPKNMMNN